MWVCADLMKVVMFDDPGDSLSRVTGAVNLTEGATDTEQRTSAGVSEGGTRATSFQLIRCPFVHGGLAQPNATLLFAESDTDALGVRWPCLQCS